MPVTGVRPAPWDDHKDHECDSDRHNSADIYEVTSPSMRFGLSLADRVKFQIDNRQFGLRSRFCPGRATPLSGRAENAQFRGLPPANELRNFVSQRPIQ